MSHASVINPLSHFSPRSRSVSRRGLIVFTATLLWLAGSITRAADAPDVRHLTPEEISAGWVELFDGKTLFGWKSNSEINWSAQDGILQADQGEKGLLLTKIPFADYELLCDVWIAKGGNSGIFLRTPFQPKSAATDCYELNMCDTHPAFKTASLVEVAQPKKVVTGDGRWLRYHVVCQGNTVRVQVQNELVLEHTDTRPAAPRTGFIGLQKNEGLVKFRNVFLKPAPMQPLFNGKDLTGWRVIPGGKSEFKVVDGAIQVLNGRGFLETEQTWADFVLQAEVKTQGDKLNSGIFFRAQPGTAEAPSNGYEAQIHNAFKGTDRTAPVDFGTGAIYRRIPARRVVSNDREWFTLTLAAYGPQISVWVNGEQVTDWVDARPPKENPREGLRTSAGHLSLQGHDPTTNILFRKLRIVPLTGRE